MTASKVKAATHTVAIASFEFAGSTATVIAAIQAGAKAGMSSEELQHEFRGGRIARAIIKATAKLTDKARDAAILRGISISMACEPGRKPKKGQAMRSTADQALFEPSKRWWSRMGRDAGIIKARKTGGKRKPKNKNKNTPKAFIASKPKDASAAMLTVQNLAQQLATYCAKYHNLLPVEVVAVCNGASLKVDEAAKAK